MEDKDENMEATDNNRKMKARILKTKMRIQKASLDIILPKVLTFYQA